MTCWIANVLNETKQIHRACGPSLLTHKQSPAKTAYLVAYPWVLALAFGALAFGAYAFCATSSMSRPNDQATSVIRFTASGSRTSASILTCTREKNVRRNMGTPITTAMSHGLRGKTEEIKPRI
jgi:hypothetical protein